jgi:hypothetical protein
MQIKKQPKIPELIKTNQEIDLDEVLLTVRIGCSWLICKDKKMYDEDTGEFVCDSKDLYEGFL